MPAPLPLPPENERYLIEADARLIIKAKFAAEGVTLNEDYQYTMKTVDFNAGGFVRGDNFGCEYHSYGDRQTYRAMAHDPIARNTLFLDDVEKVDLNTEMNSGGDAVKAFVSGQTYSLTQEADYLEYQVEQFIVWLKANGKL